jgi:hypothetical protein
MRALRLERTYQESRIEEEPILGPVLVLPSGTIQPLTFWERVLVRLRLLDARAIEARYFQSATT